MEPSTKPCALEDDPSGVPLTSASTLVDLVEADGAECVVGTPDRGERHALSGCALSPTCLVAATRGAEPRIVFASDAARMLLRIVRVDGGDHSRDGKLQLREFVNFHSDQTQASNTPVGHFLSLATTRFTNVPPQRQRTLFVCRHPLSPADARNTVLGNQSTYASPINLSEPIDVWLLEDVAAVSNMFSRLDSLDYSARDNAFWSHLLNPLPGTSEAQTCAETSSVHRRTRARSVPLQSARESRGPNQDLSPDHSQLKPSLLTQADLFIVSAEKTIINAAGIIGLASVPKWLFTQLRHYTTPISSASFPTPTMSITSSNSPGTNQESPPLPRPPPTAPPTLILRLNEFGRVNQAFPIAPVFLGFPAHLTLNRFIMRFVYTRDIARLCGGLARAQRSGMGEVFVRWDWRSCCETSGVGEEEDDEEVEEDDNNEYDSDVSASSNDEDAFQPALGNSSPQVTLQTEVRTPVPTSLMQRRRSSFGLESSNTAAAAPFSTTSIDDPTTAYGDRYPDFVDDDPALSAYTSTQPTRRPSLVEPRGDAAARFFPSDNVASSSARPPQLIWVRVRVLNSRAARALAAPTPGTPADALEEGGLVCVITPVPSAVARFWPRAGDVSDSTVGDVGLEHENGPWVECFEDASGEAHGAVARRGRVSGAARQGLLERVAMGVLGSVFKYAVRFGFAGGPGQAGREAIVGRPIPRGMLRRNF